jgi:hypothetical protein
MQKIYCSKCGSASQFEVKKPNLCGFCGELFNKAFIKPTDPIKPKKAKKIVEEDEDYEDEEETESSRAKLDLRKIAKAAARRVNISIAKKTTLGDLARQENQIIRDSQNPNALSPQND